MKAYIFDPLGMAHTVLDYRDSINSHRSDFYSIDEGKVVHAPYGDNGYNWAGGGLLSTTEDIIRFGTGVLYNKLFDEVVEKQLISSKETTNGKPTGYGMGWADKVSPAGKKYYGHRRGVIGGCGNLIICPDEELVLAFYTI